MVDEKGALQITRRSALFYLLTGNGAGANI